MGQSVYRNGTVLKGDYEGKNIYFLPDRGISILSEDENGKIIVKSFFPTVFTVLHVISTETVERHEIVSQAWNSYDIAIYFKDGKKSLIRLLSSWAFQEFQRILFEF